MPFSDALNRTRSEPGLFWMPQQPVPAHHLPVRDPQPDDAPPLTADERGELRRSLLKHRQERRNQLDSLYARPACDGVVWLAHRSAVREILADIELALSRMDGGRHARYGRCDECGNRLTVGLLRTMPFARRCDRCLLP